jgi:hypothetical protein
MENSKVGPYRDSKHVIILYCTYKRGWVAIREVMRLNPEEERLWIGIDDEELIEKREQVKQMKIKQFGRQDREQTVEDEEIIKLMRRRKGERRWWQTGEVRRGKGGRQ